MGKYLVGMAFLVGGLFEGLLVRALSEGSW